MSVTGAWTERREKRDAPCFVCATEPRLEGHSVCSKHHVEEKCHICFPQRYYHTPIRLLPKDSRRNRAGLS